MPTSNVAPERNFAVLDGIMREKLNATVIAMESLVLFSRNQTNEWFYQQSQGKRKVLTQAAISLSRVHKA